MPVLPWSDLQKVEFMEAHLAFWNTNAVTIGLTGGRVASPSRHDLTVFGKVADQCAELFVERPGVWSLAAGHHLSEERKVVARWLGYPSK